MLKEDSMDYAVYTANIPVKKGRASRAQATDTDSAQANGHSVQRSMPRRKSVAATAVEYADSGDDESDEDWGGDKARRRKSAPPGKARSRGKKQSL